MVKPRGVSNEMWFVIAAEARRMKIPFGGHLYPVISAAEASDSGINIIDHLPSSGGLDALCTADSIAQCQQVAEKLKRNGTWFVPTIFMYYGGKPRAEAIRVHFEAAVVQFLSDSIHSMNWLRATDSDSTADSLGVMHILQRAGIPILAGSDAAKAKDRLSPWGFALHAELAMLAGEGLTSLTVLQSATLNPARMWRATDSLGTVASGKLAGLVLLDADPLADITNTTTIRAVVANGRYFDRATLDGLLAEAQARVRVAEEPETQRPPP